MSHILEPIDGAVGNPAQGVHGIDPRVRIVVMAAFAVVVVALDDFVLLGIAVVLALAMAIIAHLPVAITLRRVVAMDAFVVFMLAMLPFTVPGEEMFRIGPFVATWEGLWRAIAIALKANAVVLALLALVGSMEAVTLGHALRHLRVPESIVHLLFFTVRYVEVLGDEYRRLRLAMRARAFRPRSNMHTWRSVGYLLGMLLVHSLERSERVLAAMKCRGYSGRLYTLDTFQLGRTDMVFAGAGFAVMAALVWAQFA